MNEGLLSEQESTLWVEYFVDYLVNSLYVLFTNSVCLVEVLAKFLESVFQSLAHVTANCVDTSFIIFCFSISDFQIKLLQVFLCILTIHIVAICVSWKIYSERITQRFLKPSLNQISNEQLKTGVSELKLPAEHTPRW